MGERLVCNQEAIGSIPFTSTTFRPSAERCLAVAPKRRGGCGREERRRALVFFDLGAKFCAPAL